MQPNPKFTLAVVALAAGLVPAANASAASLHGVVVHQDARAHSFVVAGPQGGLTAVHARRLPALGRHVSVTARQLRNGTWLGQHVRVAGRSSRVRLHGTVTYVNPRRGVFVLSARGVSLVVHGASVRRHDVRLASDPGVHEGEIVTVEGDVDRGAVKASRIQAAGDQASGIRLEGTVQAIDAAARTLSVSADDNEESGAAVTVQVPTSFDLGAFTVGEPVELTVSRNADGSYTLVQSSDDSSAAAADNLDAIQGDDHGGAHDTALRQCAAQQTDPAFPAAHGGLTFTQVYERNPDDAANAFGRCVNEVAHQQEAQSQGSHPEDSGSASETEHSTAPAGSASESPGADGSTTGSESPSSPKSGSGSHSGRDG